MPYAAIVYHVKPGYEDEIAGIFGGFQRVNTPVLRDQLGQRSGRLLGTAVFIRDELMIRVIHYEGSLDDLARHMAGQRGVHVLEEQLRPYLSDPRDATTPEGFAAYFQAATMRCISQLSIDTHPARDQAGAEPAADPNILMI